VAERKVKTNLAGRSVDGFEVQVEESNEKWSEFKLEDGTIFRIKVNVVNAVRVDGEYDPQGNPMYALNMVPVMALIEAPARLKKKVQ
jgi:hypothetical protein